MLRRSTAVRLSTWSLWASFVLAAAACGGNDSVALVEGVIDRETFVEVYVDLRAETLEGTDFTLSDEARDSVLARHGVDAESLVSFVEAYGRHLEFMNEVWTEVESRMRARPAAESPP